MQAPPKPSSFAIRCLRLCAVALPLLGPALHAGDAPPAPAVALVERALPGTSAESFSSGEELFEAVLASELFLSGQAGPFDVYLMKTGPQAKERAAEKLLAELLEALQPAAAVLERNWPAGGGGLISAARLPLVLTESERGEDSFNELIALLDHCEKLGYSGWHPLNLVDTPANRAAEVVRTWKVQLFNLAHPTIDQRRKEWVEHGVGYYSLAFVTNRALRQGSWGMVPPWLAHGLIDELDIAAYGKAWVGQESWTAQTPGWYRPGWSGFVPQGQTPPPPVTGPPAVLAVTVKDTGDPWLSFKESTSRHWSSLVADLKTEAPASFQRAAQTESFLPRDRAAARCLVHLLLADGSGETPLFTSLLDQSATVPSHGMPDSEPLPVLFARALGGVAEVNRLESIDSASLLRELGQDDLLARLEKHGAQAALALNDHRAQSAWLMTQPKYDSAARLELFQAFMEIEHVQQLAEWRAIAPQLDAGLGSALESSKRYPRRSKDFEPLLTAFRQGLLSDPSEATEADDDDGRTSKSRSRRKR